MLSTKILILRSAAPALAVGLLSFAAGLMTTSTESVLRQSFANALQSDPVQVPRVAKSAPLAGTEDFWLSAIAKDQTNAQQGAMKSAVAIGDRIAMTLGGVRRTLEVQSVTAIEPQITTVDTTSKPASHFVMVTANDTAAQRDATTRIVRFLMEIENASDPVKTTASTERGL